MKRPSTVETILALIKSIGRRVGQSNGYRSKNGFQVNHLAPNKLN